MALQRTRHHHCYFHHEFLQIPARIKRLRGEIVADSGTVYAKGPTAFGPPKNSGADDDSDHLPALQFPLIPRLWMHDK